MQNTANQLPRFHILLKELGIDEDTKRDMIFNATFGRTNSAKELKPAELRQLCDSLQAEVSQTPDACDKMRKKIISRAHRLGWQLPSGKIDMAAVNAWCTNYGHLRKPLMDYGYEDLVKLNNQMDKAYKSYIKAV